MLGCAAEMEDPRGSVCLRGRLRMSEDVICRSVTCSTLEASKTGSPWRAGAQASQDVACDAKGVITLAASWERAAGVKSEAARLGD